jgi:uncharacterized membrane protein YiaA
LEHIRASESRCSQTCHKVAITQIVLVYIGVADAVLKELTLNWLKVWALLI